MPLTLKKHINNNKKLVLKLKGKFESPKSMHLKHLTKKFSGKLYLWREVGRVGVELPFRIVGELWRTLKGQESMEGQWQRRAVWWWWERERMKEWMCVCVCVCVCVCEKERERERGWKRGGKRSKKALNKHWKCVKRRYKKCRINTKSCDKEEKTNKK